MRRFFAFAFSLLLFTSLAGEEVWTGLRVIDAPVELRGRSLRIAPDARLAFRGAGRLFVQDGNLTASHAAFDADGVLTNRFRIIVQNGRLDLSDCRFRGMRTVDPDKDRAHYIQGFLRSQYGGGSRIVHCSFVDCSPVMVLNAVGFEFARNLAVRCDSAFSLLNCSECRLEFNEFFDAPCGFKLSGTRLTECFRNRFTDCDVGLLAYYCRENRFMGNAFFGGRDGIQLWCAGPNGVFSGNRFEGVRTPFAKHEKTDPTNSFVSNEID